MVNQRNIVMSVILSIVTCGIYGWYWFVCMTDDLNTVSGEAGTPGVKALIFTIISCGIYGLFWAYKSGEKLDIAKQKNGIPASNGGVLYLILFIFGGIIAYALIQNELNKLANA